MMVLLNLVFLFCLFFAIFAVIASIVWGALYLAGVRNRGRWITGSFVVYCVILYLFHYSLTRPAAVFERSLGFAPTADVTELYSSVWILGDQGDLMLSFIGNREVVDRILQRGLQRQQDVGGSEHYHRKFSEHFGSESEDLYFNPSTGRVRYFWCGID